MIKMKRVTVMVLVLVLVILHRIGANPGDDDEAGDSNGDEGCDGDDYYNGPSAGSGAGDDGIDSRGSSANAGAVDCDKDEAGDDDGDEDSDHDRDCDSGCYGDDDGAGADYGHMTLWKILKKTQKIHDLGQTTLCSREHANLANMEQPFGIKV